MGLEWSESLHVSWPHVVLILLVPQAYMRSMDHRGTTTVVLIHGWAFEPTKGPKYGPNVQKYGSLGPMPRHSDFFVLCWYPGTGFLFFFLFFLVKCPRCFICAFGVENQVKEEKRGIYPEIIQQKKVALSTPGLIICWCCSFAQSSLTLLRPHGL